MKILVVEDEKKVAGFIKRGLEEDNYEVIVTHDGADGFKQALENDFSLIVLDVMLPKMDGLMIVRELRAAGNEPRCSCLLPAIPLMISSPAWRPVQMTISPSHLLLPSCWRVSGRCCAGASRTVAPRSVLPICGSIL